MPPTTVSATRATRRRAIWQRAYNYCAGNPVMMVDINGDKLYFAEGCSEEFKEAFREAVNYLKKNGCDYALARLESSDETFYIQELIITDELDLTPLNEPQYKISYNFLELKIWSRF